MQEMKDVFISYRREQGGEIAGELNRYLSSDEKGLRVFYDKIDMKTGHLFPPQLEEAIRIAPNYVLVATPNVFVHGPEEQDWVWEEIRHALNEYKNNPTERTITVLVPGNYEIPSRDILPEDIKEIADAQRIFHLSFGGGWQGAFEKVYQTVTEINRRNIWFAAHRWFENSRRPGSRFSELSISDIIIPNASYENINSISAKLPITVFKSDKRSHGKNLLSALSETGGHIYLIGEGGIGKTTALMRIMEEVYLGKEYSTKKQIPVFVELSFAPDSAFGDIYENGISTFIRRSVFSQVRSDTEINQIGKVEINGIKSVFQLPYETAVKPVEDLFSHESPAPEYLLLLDGLNEVSRRNVNIPIKGEEGYSETSIYRMICDEIRFMAEKCPNVRIVLTSRSDDSEISDNFTKLYLSGLDDESIKSFLLENKVSDADMGSIFSDDSLVESLRIPLFLKLYVSLKNKAATARGEIIDTFFGERRKNIKEYTARNRIKDLEVNISETSVKRLSDRITPDMFYFIIDFVLPEVARYMENNNLYYISKADFTELVNPLFSDRDTLSVCGRYGCEVFDAYKSSDQENDVSETADRFLKLSDDFRKITAVILNLCVNSLGILQITKGEYSFIHEYIRDYFAATRDINILKMSTYLQEHGKSGLALKCMNSVFKEYPVSSSVLRLIGECLGEHKNKPYYDDKKWFYGVPSEKCSRNLIKRALDIYRGLYNEEYGYGMYSLTEILKTVRDDLRGCDFTDLDFTGCNLNGCKLGEWGLEADFRGALISHSSLFPQGNAGRIIANSINWDSSKLLTLTDKGEAKVFSIKTGVCIAAKEFAEKPLTAKFSSEGNCIFIGNNWIEEFDSRLTNSVFKSNFDTVVFEGRDVKYVFANRSRMVAVFSPLCFIKILDYYGNCLAETHNIQRVDSVHFSEDDRFILADSYVIASKNHCQVFDAVTLAAVTEFNKTHENITADSEVFGNSPGCLAVSTPGRLRVLNTDKSKTVNCVYADAGIIKCMRFSPDDRFIAAVKTNNHLDIWECSTGRMVVSVNLSVRINDFICFSNDSRYVSIAAGASAFVYDVFTGNRILYSEGQPGERALAAFGPEDKFFLTCSHNNFVQIWDTGTLICFVTIKCPKNIKKVDFVTPLFQYPGKTDYGVIAVLDDEETLVTKVMSFREYKNEVSFDRAANRGHFSDDEYFCITFFVNPQEGFVKFYGRNDNTGLFLRPGNIVLAPQSDYLDVWHNGEIVEQIALIPGMAVNGVDFRCIRDKTQFTDEDMHILTRYGALTDTRQKLPF